MDTKHLLRMSFFVGIALFSSLHAKDVDASLEESLELRKISEYWKEKDYKTVKIQIFDFLSKNPKSSYVDQLHAMLGDLYFQEKNYADAICAYDKIQGQEFRLKSQFRRLHSLYEIGKHEEFILSADLFLKDPNARGEEINTVRFELAESCFYTAHAPENEDRKKELFKEALSQYQQLMQTKFCDLTLGPQAQAYAFLEEYPKAASLYLLLAHKDSAKREDWLFQAASLQLHFDKKSAIETFAAIVELDGKNASKAAFNKLNLLFQEKRYKDFILAQDKSLKHISADKAPLIRYYLGKSLFHTRNFVYAINPLSESLSSTTLDRAHEKSALITLIVCAKETQDLPLFEKALAQLKTEFSDDEETFNSLLMHSQLCRDRGEWAKSRADIQELLELSPCHPQREVLLYDSALTLSQESRWEESASAFEAFLKEYPKSAQKTSVLRHIVSARIEDLKHASVETQKLKQELLLDSLMLAVEEKKTFTQAEIQKMRYLMGKTQFELCQYDAAIATLTEYIRTFNKDPTCADACLLLAYCYRQGLRDDVDFALNAEQALALNPTLQGEADLHLALFNTYLGLAEKAPLDEKKEKIAKAADHLFLALNKPVNKENQHWLAGYYFQQYQNGQPEAVERAALVLEKLLGVKENSIALSSDAQSLEAEAIKLAAIYEKTGRYQQRAQLLESLINQQTSHPELNWKYQRMAQFELGKTYLLLDEKGKAIKAYADLIASSSHISSYFATAAQVEKAKLEFSMLKGKERYEDAEAVAAICDQLKEVQIKRKLYSEPLHLEAALCYIDIKTELSNADQQLKHKQFLLQQMKENFFSESDPLVSHYLLAAAQFPDKERLYKQYLCYIDAEMLRLSAEKAQNSAQMQEARRKFDQLLAESTDDTLTERIRKSTEALAQQL
jgi:tetratricopeptide (TPR) repeat protein